MLDRFFVLSPGLEGESVEEVRLGKIRLERESLLELRRGPGVVSLFDEAARDVDVPVGVVRIDLDDAAEGGLGTLVVLLKEKADPVVVESLALGKRHGSGGGDVSGGCAGRSAGRRGG